MRIFWIRWWVGLGALVAGGGCAAVPNHPAVEGEATVRPAPATPRLPRIEGADATTAGGFLAPLPRGLTSFGSATVEGHVYVVGGYSGEPHRYSREGQSKEVLRLALDGTAGWEKVAELEFGLQGLAAVSYDKKLCVFGGNRIENVASEPARMRSVDVARCWDPSTGAWKGLPPMPGGRSSHEATLVGSTVYIAGGWQLGDSKAAAGHDTARWHTTLLSLDLARPDAHWKEVEAPFRLRAVAVGSLGGKVVVVGGLKPDRAPSRAVHLFDPASGRWSPGTELPGDGFGVAATSGARGLAVSGQDGDVYLLTQPNSSWTRAGALVFPRFFHRLAWRGDETLAAIGGITGMQPHGRTRPTELLSIPSPQTRVSRLTFAYPGVAKNRQAAFVHEDFLYLFGGNASLGQHDFEPHHFVDEGLRLHLPSLTFSTVAPFPVKRQTMQLAVSSDHAVSVGGFGHDGEQAVSFAEAFRFDFAREAWSSEPALPRGRTQFGLVEHDGALLIFGGLNYDPTRSGSAFDHVIDTLRRASPGAAFQPENLSLPGPRRAFGSARLGDDVYFIGGMREGFQLVDDCLKLSLQTRAYTPQPCPRKPRLSSKLLAVGGKLYLLAGSSKGADGKLQAERSIEVFDPATGSWSTLVEDVGFDTTHSHAMVYRSTLLLVSTHNDQQRITMAFVPLR